MGVNLIMTKPNTVQAKKNMYLLFVNNRLVESDKIKRVIENGYAMYQPKGGYSYLVYMALSVRPDLIDVNVHPTKKQVIIERQDDLCELLGDLLDFTFTQQTASRQFQAQTKQVPKTPESVDRSIDRSIDRSMDKSAEKFTQENNKDHDEPMPYVH